MANCLTEQAIQREAGVSYRRVQREGPHTIQSWMRIRSHSYQRITVRAAYITSFTSFQSRRRGIRSASHSYSRRWNDHVRHHGNEPIAEQWSIRVPLLLKANHFMAQLPNLLAAADRVGGRFRRKPGSLHVPEALVTPEGLVRHRPNSKGFNAVPLCHTIQCRFSVVTRFEIQTLVTTRFSQSSVGRVVAAGVGDVSLSLPYQVHASRPSEF
jgi:hypothetical protein